MGSSRYLMLKICFFSRLSIFCSNHGPQEGPHHRLKALRLVIGHSVASVLYLFDPKARVNILQFLCRFKGNNAVIPDD
jgi:hypothetical protein